MAHILRSLFRRTTTALKLSEPMKMTLVVRTDLHMSSGKIASQCSHAAVACLIKAQKQKLEVVNAWIDLGQPKVVLRARSQAQIENLAKMASEQNVINSLIRDAGRTEVEPGTITALGIGPDTVKNVDSITRKLKLL